MKLPMYSFARLRQIETRQCDPKWGKEYEPAMKATRDEAPRISRPGRAPVVFPFM